MTQYWTLVAYFLRRNFSRSFISARTPTWDVTALPPPTATVLIREYRMLLSSLNKRIDKVVFGGQLPIEHQHGETMNERPGS